MKRVLTGDKIAKQVFVIALAAANKSDDIGGFKCSVGSICS